MMYNLKGKWLTMFTKDRYKHLDNKDRDHAEDGAAGVRPLSEVKKGFHGSQFSSALLQSVDHDINAAVNSIRWAGEEVLVGARKTWRYLHFDEVPAYIRDNEFIRSGYRWGDSYKDNWKSLFKIHNETVNVWSHLLGAAFFGYKAISIFRREYEPAVDHRDVRILCTHLLCATACLIMSALFHLHFCHSERAYLRFSCLDYSGISILTCSSAASIVYFLFKSNASHQILWLSVLIAVNLVGFIGPFIITSWPTAEFRPKRSTIFVVSGILSLSPLFHYYFYHKSLTPLPSFIESFAVPGSILTIILYVSGVVFYVSRIPERLAPGFFDYILHSHQLWHILVVAAVYVQYRSLLGFISWNSGIRSK